MLIERVALLHNRNDHLDRILYGLSYRCSLVTDNLERISERVCVGMGMGVGWLLVS